MGAPAWETAIAKACWQLVMLSPNILDAVAALPKVPTTDGGWNLKSKKAVLEIYKPQPPGGSIV